MLFRSRDAFGHFHFHEYRVNGKTLAQSVEAVAAGLTLLESEVFEGLRQSQSSFYQVKAAVPDEHQIRLQDLLTPQPSEVLLTDVSLSQFLLDNGLPFALFCRAATVRGLTMTNGASLTFYVEDVPGLLQAYRQKTKKVPPEDMSEHRFIFFFQKHRQIGVPQAIATPS